MPKSKKPVFNARTKWTAPNFTLYPEHFGITQEEIENDREAVIYRMRQALSAVLNDILSSGKKVDMCAIVHHEDTKSGTAENIMTPSLEKPHVHLLFLGDKEVRMSFYLALLAKYGISYRLNPEEEQNDIAFINSGEAVQQTKDICAFIVYLTHETTEALADADKSTYDVSDLITTFSPEQISEIHYKYKTGQRKPLKRSQRNDEMQSYCNMAYAAGFSLDIEFEDWFSEYVPPVDRNNCKAICLDAYNRGQDKKLESLNNHYTRACIFIQGSAALGKTATASNALSSLGYHPLSITKGSKTGATDKFKPCYNKALIYNDTQVHDILSTCDNSISYLYRRNSGNRPNLCDYIVVTSNVAFSEYLKSYDFYTDEELKACFSRFFLCRVDSKGFLVLSATPNRCKGEEAEHQKALYEKFATAYNDDRRKYLLSLGDTEVSACSDISVEPVTSDEKVSACSDTFEEHKRISAEARTALSACTYAYNDGCGKSLICSDCSSCPFYLSGYSFDSYTDHYDFVYAEKTLSSLPPAYAGVLIEHILKYYRKGGEPL